MEQTLAVLILIAMFLAVFLPLWLTVLALWWLIDRLRGLR